MIGVRALRAAPVWASADGGNRLAVANRPKRAAEMRDFLSKVTLCSNPDVLLIHRINTKCLWAIYQSELEVLLRNGSKLSPVASGPLSVF
jgi:hypothetical protein